MLQVGKPIFFPTCLPFLTTPCIVQYLFKRLFALFKKPFSKRFLIKDDDTIFLFLIYGLGLTTLYLNNFSYFFSILTLPSLLFPNLELLLTKINLELNFLFKI